MASIKRFEDIEAWQEARAIVKKIYETSRTGYFAKDYGLKDQITRAAVSIMSNIAEGFERGSNKEFRHFLYVAKGSAGEVRSLLCVTLDLGYVSKERYAELQEHADKISRKIAAFIKYLGKKER